MHKLVIAFSIIDENGKVSPGGNNGYVVNLKESDSHPLTIPILRRELQIFLSALGLIDVPDDNYSFEVPQLMLEELGKSSHVIYPSRYYSIPVRSFQITELESNCQTCQPQVSFCSCEGKGISPVNPESSDKK